MRIVGFWTMLPKGSTYTFFTKIVNCSQNSGLWILLPNGSSCTISILQGPNATKIQGLWILLPNGSSFTISILHGPIPTRIQGLAWKWPHLKISILQRPIATRIQRFWILLPILGASAYKLPPNLFRICPLLNRHICKGFLNIFRFRISMCGG